MQEKDSKDMTPEEIVEELKIEGKIDEDTYKEILYRFEDIEDIHNKDKYQIYEKAYQNERMHKCIEILLEISNNEPDRVKKGMLRSNCLKNPMGVRYSEEDYRKTMIILEETIKEAKKKEYSKQVLKDIWELLLYTHCFYSSNFLNTRRLEKNEFAKYSLSKQLRMICIYIQDQSRLMRDEIFGGKKKRSYITGVEWNVANRPIDHAPNQKISLADNYEGMLEFINTYIRYLFFSKRKDLKVNDIHEHGDIHPFLIPEFEEIMYIANQRRMYEMVEEEFRYGDFNIDLTKDKLGKDVYLFQPKNIEKYKLHYIGALRRDYQYRTNITKNTNVIKIQEALNMINDLAKKVNVDDIEGFHPDKVQFKKTCAIANSVVDVYSSLTKEYYFECNINGDTVYEIIEVYTFLHAFSQIYITAIQRNFKQEKKSTYKYLVPVISIDYLENEFARLYDKDKKQTKRLLSYYIYDEKIRDNEGDIFSRPLLKINKTQILLCESLIEQINIERCVEKLLQKYKIDLSPVGTQFEKKLIDRLRGIKGISVNTNHIKFKAYDNRDVEFDFLGTLEDYLLLFEFKSVVIPYDTYEVYKREKVIKEGVEQVKRRCDIIQHDWNRIREMVNIDLPDIPYEYDKIIKVVCTNIYDFTTLHCDDVRVTDESTLLKYFTNPFVFMYSKDKEMTEIFGAECIWKEGYPTASEFIKYLDSPVTVGNIPKCFEEEIKTLPAFEGDNLIAFKDIYLARDPYRESIDKMLYVSKSQKIYPNEKCPCGSGKKYKNCCRNKM